MAGTGGLKKIKKRDMNEKQHKQAIADITFNKPIAYHFSTTSLNMLYDCVIGDNQYMFHVPIDNEDKISLKERMPALALLPYLKSVHNLC